jgi:hypothetical protein
MPPVLGPVSPFADALVVLRRNERRHVLAVAEAEEADLVALEEFLQNDLRLRLAQQRAGEDALGGLQSRLARLADDDALARVQPVGLDHNGRMEELNGFFDFGLAFANHVARGGNLVPLQEALGEALAGFQHGCRARRPEDAQALGLQGVHNAQRKRHFRPHDRQPRLLGLGQLDHGLHALQIHRNAARNLTDAAVARRAHHFRDLFAAFHSPGQRVLPAPRPQNQNLHCTAPHGPRIREPSTGYPRQPGCGKSNRRTGRVNRRIILPC